MAHPSQLGLQDAASPIIEELIHFHDHALVVMIFVSSVVFYMIITTLTTKLTYRHLYDSQEIEVV